MAIPCPPGQRNSVNAGIAVSIIIPTLNTTRLDEAIEGVLADARGRDDVEVIVAGLDRFDRRLGFDSVRFISSGSPVYPGAARNLGASIARGQLLVFLDADCVPRPGWLNALERAFSRGADVVGGSVSFDPEGYWTRADNAGLLHEFLPEWPRASRKYLASLNFAIRSKVFAAVSGFDGDLRSAEDLDLTSRLSKQGFNMVFEPDAVVAHHPSRTGPVDIWRHHFTYGANSAKVRLRHPDNLSAPWLLRWPLLLAVVAPVVALATTLRIICMEPPARIYWSSMPGIYLAKLAWCLSAVRGVLELQVRPDRPAPISVSSSVHV